MTESKSDYYTRDWYALQNFVLRQAKWVCSDCGWRAVVAHHLTYAFGVLCPAEHLVALCDLCHRGRHGKTNYRREHYLDHQKRLGWVKVDDPGQGTRWIYGHGWFRRSTEIAPAKKVNIIQLAAQ